jgi:serine protease Do
LNPDIARPLLPERISKNIQYFAGRTWLLPKLIEWIENSDDRFFILQGSPGTGKSMIMAWLAGVGPRPTSDEQAKIRFERINSLVKGVHFCEANTGSINPTTMAGSLAKQLTKQTRDFSDALADSLSNRVQISATISGGVANSITGNYIEELHLGDLNEDSSFDLSLRVPLKKLYESGYHESIIFLVDALDESLTYSGRKKIVEILASLSDIPKNVRFVMTTRGDPSVMVRFQNIQPFDLVKDAPAIPVKDNQIIIDDIYLYVLERMRQIISTDPKYAGVDSIYTEDLATKISKAAKGIFLYAHLLFSSILPKFPNIPEFIESGLPDGLGGLYNSFLNREIGTNEERWYNDFRPLLGLISVSQGKGLTKNQLNNIIGHDIEYYLLIWKEYLEGPFPDGPFHIFHKSFSDFLLEDRKENINRRINAEEMHRRIADHYGQGSLSWEVIDWEYVDEYALRYLPTHLSVIARSNLQQTKEKVLYGQKLLELARNEKFASEQVKRIPDEPDLRLETAKLALSGAIEIDDPVSQAEFLLSLSHNVSQMTFGESPIGLLKKGGSLKRAWQLADMPDKEISFLWYLLLAWYLYGRRLNSEAIETLERLVKKNITILQYVKMSPAYLLASVYSISPSLFKSLYTCVSNRNEEHLRLGRILISHRNLDNPALEIYSKLQDDIIYTRVGEIAASQAEAGNFDKAIEIANKLNRKRTKARVLAQIATQAGEFDKAVDIVDKHISNQGVRYDALADIAAAQAQAGFKEESIKTFDAVTQSFQRLGGKPHKKKVKVLAQIATAQAQAGFKEEAIKTFDTAIEAAEKEIVRLFNQKEGEMQEAKALAQIATAQAKAGFKEESVKTFEKAKNIAETLKNDSLYSDIAAALAEAGNFDKAIEIANKPNKKPTKAKALAQIAGAQAEAGFKKESMKTVDAAIQTLQHLAEKFHDKKLDTLTQMATAQTQAGNFDKAIEIAEMIREHDNERAELITKVAAAQAKAGFKEESVKTFEKAKNIAETLKNDSLYSDIAAALAEAGFKEEAVQTFENAIRTAETKLNPQDEANVHWYIAAAQAQAGNFDKAIEIDQMIREHDSERAELITKVAAAQAKAGFKEESVKTFEKAKSLDQALKNGSLFTDIAAAQAQAGFKEEAVKTFEKAKALRNGSLFEDIAAAQAKAGFKEESVKTFEKAIEAAERTEDSSFKLSRYRTKANALAQIAAAQVQAGFSEEAIRTFDKAMNAYQNTTEEPTIFSILHSVNKEELDALAQIAGAQAEAGYFDEAIETVGMIEAQEAKGSHIFAVVGERTRTAVALAQIATAKAQAGFKEVAIETFDAALQMVMISAVQSQEGETAKAKALAQIATAQAQVGFKEVAIKTFARALEQARSTFGVYDDAFNQYTNHYTIRLNYIAEQQVKAGLGTDAIETLSFVRMNKNESLLMLANLFFELGEMNHLKSLLPQCYAYIDVSYGICGLLCKAYPEQCKQISRIMKTFAKKYGLI